jgi:hypothetical protein
VAQEARAGEPFHAEVKDLDDADLEKMDHFFLHSQDKTAGPGSEP